LKSKLPSRAEGAAFLVALSVFGWAQRSNAGGPIGPNGAPIQTSEYALDLFHGPVFAGSRVTGLAGAYVAISEDVDGDIQNPAAPAVRPFFSYSHFDYWIGFGLTFPATLQNTDFFNSGSSTHIANAPDSFVFFTPALNLQFGDLGVGANLEMQQYALSQPAANGEQGTQVKVTIPTMHLQFAYGLDHNQWVLGAGARLVSMSVRESRGGSAAFTSNGTGLEFGGVYKPENVPLRVGVAFRSAVRTLPTYKDDLLPDDNGDLTVTGTDGNALFLPKSVAFPWDLNFGFAVQFGPRPLNPPWRSSSELVERQTLEHRLKEFDREEARSQALNRATTEKEKEEIEQKFDREQEKDDKVLDDAMQAAHDHIEADLTKMNRFYVMIAASAVVTGAVKDAVGVESLVSQTVNRSGQSVVISPRLGVESGIFPNFLKVRAGTYLEPTRFEGSSARMHGTFGLDIKLIKWNVFGVWPDDYMWRLGLGADVAARYATWGITIAGWYPRHADASDFKKVNTPAPASGPPPIAGITQ
jgi:hypothetical protein